MRRPRIKLPHLRLPRRKVRPARTPVRILRAPRRAALVAIACLVAAASLTSFAESYRALWLWASHHDLHGVWAYAWPVQVDTFIAVGELALFVALVDAWSFRSRIAAWIVTAIGLAVSVAGNVGHVHGHLWSVRATAAVPPIAAAAALAVGLGVLKRVVEHHGDTAASPDSGAAEVCQEQTSDAVANDLGDKVWSSSFDAARHRLEFAAHHGFKVTDTELRDNFRLTRSERAKVRTEVLADTNGYGGGDDVPDGS